MVTFFAVIGVLTVSFFVISLGIWATFLAIGAYYDWQRKRQGKVTLVG